MKKTICIFILACFNAGAFAQSSNVTSAYKYMKDFEKYQELNYLNLARQRIDTASVHEKTRGEAKTWNYRSIIYQMIFENNLKIELEKLKDETDKNKKTLTAYSNVPVKELSEAVISLKKNRELDVKKIYSEETDRSFKRCSQHFENIGIAQYNSKNYETALSAFENVLGIQSVFGKTDTINLYNAALACEKGKMYDKAKAYYLQLIDQKYGKGQSFSRLSDIYLALKDSSGAMDVIRKGRTLYPEDLNLLISETNFFLATNKQALALDNLKLAIQKDPANANLYLVAGNVLDNIANPKDNRGNDLDKPKNYSEMIGRAEDYYKKAVEINPEYFDAIYNLGILYNNRGVYFAKKADSITDQTKYAAESKKAENEFQKAIPLLEKAHGLNSTDRNTMLALKQLYARTQQKEKMEQMGAKLKNN